MTWPGRWGSAVEGFPLEDAKSVSDSVSVRQVKRVKQSNIDADALPHEGGIAMSVFTRFGDIVSANISDLLDNAEDPERTIRLMIQEMEDALVEIKASCAGAMAGNRTAQREAIDAKAREKVWYEKAEIAVNNGTDDLAREALVERRRHAQQAETLEKKSSELADLAEKCKADIGQLEKKLRDSREERRILTKHLLVVQDPTSR